MSVRKRQWRTSKGVIKEAWIVDYVDKDGDQHIKTVEGKKDAEDYEATVRIESNKGLHVAPSKSPAVKEAAETWLARVKANGMNGDGPAESTTLRQYRQHVDL